MSDTEHTGARKSESVPGPNLPNYKIIRRIDGGAQGEVYLAENLRLRKRVAIKRVSGDGAGVDERDLKSEARTAARLNHPGIATVYDLVEVDGRWYIVMEFVEGETLAARIQRERLSVETAVRIAVQIAEAMTHAHDYGVIHRDLKPANIGLTPEGAVKVLDFGIAKTQVRLNYGDGTTISDGDRHSFGGTPAYMSPEQFGQGAVDPRSDVYNLGVVLFEMLAGRLPFTAANIMELSASILRDPPPSLKDLRPDVPDAVCAVVLRAMSKSRDERYASMSAFRDGLLAAETAPAAAAVSSRQGQTEASPVLAIFPFLNLTGDPANDFIGAGICEVLIANASDLSGMTVLSRASVSSFREMDRDLMRAARDLGAGYIVDGSYQRFGDRIRLTVTLLEAESGRVTWRHQMDGAASSIFEMQTALSQKLAAALTPDQPSRGRGAGFPTDSVEAFGNYARARVLLERKDVPGNLDRSIELLNQALRQDPRFALAHSALGEAYWERYQRLAEPQWTFKALSSLAEALRLEPNRGDVRRTLATIYRGTGRNVEALEELRLTLNVEPANDETHRSLGNVLFDLGRGDEALEHFEQAIRLRPNSWENHLELGKALYRMARYERAVVSFSRAVELQPDNAWGHMMLGTTYHAMGDTGNALLYCERSMAISPNATAATNIGTILYGKKNYADALKCYDLAISLKPNKPLLYRNRGDAYLRLGELEKARESFERAVELTEELIRINPKDAEELSRLAVYEAKLGRFESARKHAAEAGECDPLRVEILYRAAVVQALAGDKARAAAQLRAAVDRGYSFSNVMDDDDLQELRESEPFIALFGPARLS